MLANITTATGRSRARNVAMICYISLGGRSEFEDTTNAGVLMLFIISA